MTLRLALLLTLVLIGCQEKHSSPSPSSAPAAQPAPPEAAFGPIDTTLNHALHAIELQSGGRIGLAAIHLESGWRTSYRGGETFPMASVAKLPMAIKFLQMVQAGTYRLDSMVRLAPIDRSPGRSRFFARVSKAGGTTTLHDVLEAMLVNSDNTACDFILRLCGGPRPVNALMDSLGFRHIDISNSERDLILLWAGIDPKSSDTAWTQQRVNEKIAAVEDSVLRNVAARMANDPADAASPEQMALLLQMLQHPTILRAAANDTLLAIMSRAATGKARLAALLPEGTPIAHKTGTISTTTNDVGIVTLPEGRGHLVIAVFVKASGARILDREHAIAQASKLLYDRMVTRASQM